MPLDELQVVGAHRSGLGRDQPHDVGSAGRSGAAALLAEQAGAGGQQELEGVHRALVELDGHVALSDGVLLPEASLSDGSASLI